MDSTLIKKANHDWEAFKDSLSEEEKKELSQIEDAVGSNNLFYYIVIKDEHNFDLTIRKLSKRYLFDEDIIPMVYGFYVQRDLHELAFDYLMKAEEYFKSLGKENPTQIQPLLDDSESNHLLSKYRINLERIRNISHKNIPRITPDIINNKRDLNRFILNEIVQASKVLLDKIHGIKQITHEDRYNDLLLAILRLRFPIWGWIIMDQPRMGSSKTGKSAGEIDILVQTGGSQNIALIEALILSGRDKTETEKHITKCFDYIPYLERYYMIVYYRGPSGNFDSTWNSYKADVLTSPFPPDVTLDSSTNFQDLIATFDDVRPLKIEKTNHVNGVEIFHIMIDLSVS